MKTRIWIPVFVLSLMAVFPADAFSQGGAPTYGWTKMIGDSYGGSKSVATDDLGNLYLVGSFKFPVDFGADFETSDYKTPLHTAQYSSDIFITKINSDGTYGWTKRIGTPDPAWDAVCMASGIAVDSNAGSIYVIGTFRGNVNFGLDFGATDIRSPQGHYDAFVTRIKNDGTYEWTKQFGGAYESTSGYCIATDPQGTIYLSGVFTGLVNFGANFGQSDWKYASEMDMTWDPFITKLNPDGTYGWTKQIAGDMWESITSIACDPSGNVFLAGDFLSTADFGFDFGVTDILTGGRWPYSDGFLTKIKADGSYGWTRLLLSSSGLGVDEGTVSTTIDFEGDVYAIGMNEAEGGEAGGVFVYKFDSSGNSRWCRKIDGSVRGGQVVASRQDVFIVGSFSGTVDFGNDFGVVDSRTAYWANDAFISKITSAGFYRWTRIISGSGNVSACRLAIDPSLNLLITGAFGGTVNFAADFGQSDIKSTIGDQSDIFITKIVALSGNDYDGDGIENAIDADPENYSSYFCDIGLVPAGTTCGSILNRGGQDLWISEEPNPLGIRVQAKPGGGADAALLKICGTNLINQISVDGIDDFYFKCGSAVVAVDQGSVDILLVTGTQITVSSSAAVTVKEVLGGLEIKNSGNSGNIFVVDKGVESVLGPGDRLIIAVAFGFQGFFSPVENPPALNSTKAGQTIPLKWRITDSDGAPITDPASFQSLKSYKVDCTTRVGNIEEAVVELAAGSSGLQNLGNGYWQINWKTPKAYLGQCRSMVLALSDKQTYTAIFSFK
jgi:hypothetical protein